MRPFGFSAAVAILISMLMLPGCKARRDDETGSSANSTRTETVRENRRVGIDLTRLAVVLLVPFLSFPLVPLCAAVRSRNAVVGGPGVPWIALTCVPGLGSSEHFAGRVLHVAPGDYHLAVYLYAAGGWWGGARTELHHDGTFSVDIVLGGAGLQALVVAAFLLPASYTPPQLAGELSMPEGLQSAAVASVGVTR